jgi:hypothetical protein
VFDAANADAQAADHLCQGLCVERQRMLLGQQIDLDRHLLSGRASAGGAK